MTEEKLAEKVETGKLKAEERQGESVVLLAAPAPKPGWQTSEFWLTALTFISTVAGTLSGLIPGDTAVILATVSTVTYQLSRAFVKRS